MSLKSKEMAEYFKENIAYKRLLKCIKNKYVSLGEIKGNVIINNPDELERQALSGLMKKDYSKNKSISVNLMTLQERINNSKFAGADLKKIIEEYFNEVILTKKETRHDYEAGLENFLNEILNINIDTKIYEYLKKIIESKNFIYYNLKMHYNKNRTELKDAITIACNGINRLPNEKVRIPVFASKIDPEGIQIADKLKQRYGKNLKFIGFNKNTYYNNLSEVKLPENRLKKLENIKSNELNL